MSTALTYPSGGGFAGEKARAALVTIGRIGRIFLLTFPTKEGRSQPITTFSAEISRLGIHRTTFRTLHEAPPLVSFSADGDGFRSSFGSCVFDGNRTFFSIGSVSLARNWRLWHPCCALLCRRFQGIFQFCSPFQGFLLLLK